jgi:hypothetical protein
MKTAIKQYALVLGYHNAGECPSKMFLKPDNVRNRLLDAEAPPTLGSDGLRNLKNNISYLLRKAIEHEILPPLGLELASWKSAKRFKNLPRRNENVFPPEYILKTIPLSLEHEIKEYETWSTKIHNRMRPKSLRKRPISFRSHRRTILLEAGFLIKNKGVRKESITLLSLIEPTNVIDYVEWYIEQQGRHTAGSSGTLGRLIAIAKYLEITNDSVEKKSVIEQWMRELRRFRESLGAPVKVRDRDQRWLSLRELERVGLSIYPLNARRISEFSESTRVDLERDWKKRYNRTFRRYAFRVQQSLLIRFALRIPLRQRNLREMTFNPTTVADGQNLYKRDGSWQLKFRGTELKIAEVKGETHSIQYPFPSDLIGLLEEWLHKWRPILISAQDDESIGCHSIKNGQEFVFLNYLGQPLSLQQVNMLFQTATYKFTGVAVNPHMIRTIFATEYIKSTNNFIDAAYMLGDTVKTVINTYAKLLDDDCGKRASQWVSRNLHEESSSTERKERITSPKLVYPLGR